MISLRTLSSLIFLLICILTLAEVFIFLPNSTEITATLICIFVSIEFTKIPLPQQISGLILVVISIICGLVSNEWRSIILDGLARTSIFLVLFFGNHSISAVKLFFRSTFSLTDEQFQITKYM